MILNYIKSDLYRYTGEWSVYLCIKHLLINRSFKYSFWFRLCKVKNPLLKFLAKLIHRKLSRKYNIQIPNTLDIGYGLFIGHHMCVVINATTKIGNNCNISQFLSIGSNYDKAAIIGDNVYIGPNVCIVENVNIGNNSIIGAGAVVTKDIPEGATVAGVPAKIISMENPGRYILNRWDESKTNT